MQTILELSELYYKSNIDSVAIENSIIELLHSKLKNLELIAFKAKHKYNNIKFINEKQIITYDKLYYNDKVTIQADVVNLDLMGESNKYDIFVTKDYIDRIFENYYQKSNLTNSIEVIQEMLFSDDSSITPILTKEYFYGVFLTKENRTIIDSYLNYDEKSLEDINNNELIGYISMKDFFVESSVVIDLSDKKIKGIKSYVDNETIYIDNTTLKDSDVNSLYISKSGDFLNISHIQDLYLTEENMTITKEAKMLNNTSISNVNYIDNKISNKAKQYWVAKDIEKEDSNETNVVNEIYNVLVNGGEIEENEIISYEELKEVLQKVSDKIKEVVENC